MDKPKLTFFISKLQTNSFTNTFILCFILVSINKNWVREKNIILIIITDREINGLKNNNCFYIVKSDVLIKNTSAFNYIQRINKTF